MAATHADRAALGENPTFVARVQGALEVVANAVGLEALGNNVPRSVKRTQLIDRVLTDPTGQAARFARAAAGSNVADTAYATAGTVNLAAVTDTQITNFVTIAWDILAGVVPYERSA